jgi:ABC-type multidrug transport system fused ATPase/permease subunit
MVLADIHLSDIIWSMLWLFFLFIWIMILVQVLIDLFRDHTMGGVAKALWVVALIFLPFITVFVYIIARGSGMAERSMKQAQAQQKQFDSYVQSVAAPTGPAEQIEKAKALLDAGTISQAEFDQLKAKALS